MLLNFEEITSELSDYEQDVILPWLSRNIARRVGKERAIKNERLCSALNGQDLRNGYKATPVRIRKLIGALRLLGQPAHICSSSNGYYVAANRAEAEENIESLSQRIRQQQRTIEALNDQLKKSLES